MSGLNLGEGSEGRDGCGAAVVLLLLLLPLLVVVVESSAVMSACAVVREVGDGARSMSMVRMRVS